MKKGLVFVPPLAILAKASGDQTEEDPVAQTASKEQETILTQSLPARDDREQDETNNKKKLLISTGDTRDSLDDDGGDPNSPIDSDAGMIEERPHPQKAPRLLILFENQEQPECMNQKNI